VTRSGAVIQTSTWVQKLIAYEVYISELYRLH